MEKQVFSFSHKAMSTEFEILISGDDQEYARQAADAAFREIDRMERLLSRYDPGSDIGQINLLKPGGTVRVTADTMECILTALWVYNETGGAFDATIGPLINCWRDKEGHARQPSDSEIERARQITGMERLTIDPDHFSIGWKDLPTDWEGGHGISQGFEIDLGGIGKGFSIDKAAEVLDDWSIRNALINGGTSTVLALGTAPNQNDGWVLGIGGPWGKKCGMDHVVLKDLALSGSGKEVKGEHIIDPQTGRPTKTHIAAWAICPSAAVSDALSTAFMIMHKNQIEAFCRRNPKTEAYIVPASQQLIHIQ